MNNIGQTVRQNLLLIKTKTGKQTFGLFISQIIFIGLGVVTAILHTRILGPEDYGVLAFFMTLTSFVVIFFRFGFFSSIGLLLARAKEPEKEKELIGTSLLISSLIGIAYALLIFAASFFVDSIFKTNINQILRIVSPLLIIMPFQFLILSIGKGSNKIKQIAWFNIIPRSLYIIGILSILALKIFEINVTNLIILNTVTVIIGVGIILYNFKPILNNLLNNLKIIWKTNKEYGIHLYLGQIFDQPTYKLDGIFITYFVNTTQLGFYTLATTITSPMIMLSQSLSTSLFKDFIDKEKIPKKSYTF